MGRDDRERNKICPSWNFSLYGLPNRTNTGWDPGDIPAAYTNQKIAKCLCRSLQHVCWLRDYVCNCLARSPEVARWRVYDDWEYNVEVHWSRMSSPIRRPPPPIFTLPSRYYSLWHARNTRSCFTSDVNVSRVRTWLYCCFSGVTIRRSGRDTNVHWKGWKLKVAIPDCAIYSEYRHVHFCTTVSQCLSACGWRLPQNVQFWCWDVAANSVSTVLLK